ncbi:hypothetical protein P2A61_22020, partial [Xanthomonas perforans]
PNFERDEVVDEPMEAPFYPATSCFHKRNRILRVIFIRMSAEPLRAPESDHVPHRLLSSSTSSGRCWTADDDR